jgi:hypothetical protein
MESGYASGNGAQLIELSSACTLDPTLNTVYFALDPPDDFTQIHAPFVNPGESICRSLLKSVYGDDVYFHTWYERAKATDTIPVYAYTSGLGPFQETYVVAVVDHPGVTLHRTHDARIDARVLESLKNLVAARVFGAPATHDDQAPTYSQYGSQYEFTPSPPSSPPPMYAPRFGAESPQEAWGSPPPKYMPNRVLVLCQRSSSEGADRDSVSQAVEQLHQFVRERVDNPILEFMTPGLKSGASFGADYKFALTLDPLGKDFDKSSQFINQNQGRYAAVVLHTCPYLFTLQIVPAMSGLLRKDGIMFWTTSTEGRQSVALLPQATFDKVIGQFTKDYGDRWQANFKDFQVIAPGLFVKV